MLDLQDDERIIVEVRQSKIAVLVPAFLACVLVGAVAYFVSWGFYAFRDELLFGKLFPPAADSWLREPVHQTIAILGGLIFLIVTTFILVKILQRRSAAKRTEEGKPPKPQKSREGKLKKGNGDKVPARKSRQRQANCYTMEKYLMIGVIVLGIVLGLFAFEHAPFWYYVVITAVPLGAYLYLCWHMTRYILTNKRLIINAGFFSHFFWDLPFDKYDQISGVQKIIERLFRFGDLIVNSVGGSREAITNVPKPQVMRKKFHAMREEYQKRLVESAMGNEEEGAPEKTPGKQQPEEKKPPQDDESFLNQKPPEDFDA